MNVCVTKKMKSPSSVHKGIGQIEKQIHNKLITEKPKPKKQERRSISLKVPKHEIFDGGFLA